MIQIGRRDIFWNYGATFLKIASSALLLPFILRMMPAETVGIWSVFMTITSFAYLLDFGFSPSFTRNVTYVFSGVKKLKTTGVEPVSQEDLSVDYGLLKGVITAMRWFYLRMAIILFAILFTLGTWYIHSLLINYKGDINEVYISWVILCSINTYNLYTQYYDSLLQGKGLIKKSKQIVIIGQSVYLVIAAGLILAGYGLVAIVSAQASSVIIIRWLSYQSFFSHEIKQKLIHALARPQIEVLKAIYPNAIKMGLTSLGGFLVQRSSIIIGSLYLTLEEIASYGITIQLIAVIAALAGIYTTTYQPKIAQLRVEQNNQAIKELYLKGQIILLGTYLIGGTGLILLGEWGLNLIGSQTRLIPAGLVLLSVIVSLLENNQGLAAGIILTRNEVPFLNASLFSGGLTVFLLLIFFQYTRLDLLAMIAAPGIAQGVYQNWKWPVNVIQELKITKRDISKVVFRILMLK